MPGGLGRRLPFSERVKTQAPQAPARPAMPARPAPQAPSRQMALQRALNT